MPILEVEIVGAIEREGLAAKLADAAATALEAPAARTWVRLRLLPRDCYAEGGGEVPDSVEPVFATLLLAKVPSGEELARRVARLSEAIASVCQRPVENVHVLTLPAASGRMAFGGQLLP